MAINVRIEERGRDDRGDSYHVGRIGDLEACGADALAATAAVETRAERALTGDYAPLLQAPLHRPPRAALA